MSFVTEWSTADQKRLVIFTPEVLRIFGNYRQTVFCQPEAGGILLGHRRGKHLEVVLATEPTQEDKCSAFSFIREAAGHAELAKSAWLQGGKAIDYLGEWHTHPQTTPIPSTIDRREWNKLVQVHPTKSPFLVIVVGTKAMHVELVGSQPNQALTPIGTNHT